MWICIVVAVYINLEQKIRNMHQEFCINHEIGEVVLPVKDKEKILKYSIGSKSIKHSFVVYANFKTLLEMIDGSENKPKKSFTMDLNVLQCNSTMLMMMIK